ncbi:MAG: hypothetical protein OXT63_06240 [Gemmatimonadota bacterium]|nr:hypothetical protein [Gemmatimonadota bacterium]
MSIRKAFRHEYGREPDAAEAVLVRSAERIQARIHEVRRLVKRDGVTTESRANGVMLHPALAHEVRLEGALLRVLKALALTPPVTKSGRRVEKDRIPPADEMAVFAERMNVLPIDRARQS